MIYDHCLRNKKLMKNKKVLITDASIMEHSRFIKILEISKSSCINDVFKTNNEIVANCSYCPLKLKSCSKLQRIKIRLKNSLYNKRNYEIKRHQVNNCRHHKEIKVRIKLKNDHSARRLKSTKARRAHYSAYTPLRFIVTAQLPEVIS
jgi:hypothetical protein